MAFGLGIKLSANVIRKKSHLKEFLGASLMIIIIGDKMAYRQTFGLGIKSSRCVVVVVPVQREPQ